MKPHTSRMRGEAMRDCREAIKSDLSDSRTWAKQQDKGRQKNPKRGGGVRGKGWGRG